MGRFSEKEIAKRIIYHSVEEIDGLRKQIPIKCGECKYFVTEKSTGISWCRTVKGLDGELTADMYCCRAEENEDKQKCRVCGCTWNNACPGGCYWVEEDLCSKCEYKAHVPKKLR